MKQRTKIIFLVYSALVIFMSSACIYMSHMIKSRYQDTSSEINIYKNVYIGCNIYPIPVQNTPNLSATYT